MHEESWNHDKFGFLPHIEFRTRADSSHYETLEEILEEADFRLTSVAIQISDTVCFEITGTACEFVSHSLEGGYSLQTEKIPAGYRLLLLKEGEVGQS